MKHLNGNLLCVIDVETTGFDPAANDIVEICVLPLDFALDPHQRILPFSLEMAPRRLDTIDPEIYTIQKRLDSGYGENMCQNMEKIKDLVRRGVHQDKGAEMFVEWFERLLLPSRKRIMPIAHNWVFDRAFIIEWLGWKTFDYIIHPCYRDTMCMSLFENDVHDCRGSGQYPFPKNNLAYLCSQLKVERPRAHTALDDCVATAQVFKKMVHSSLI